MITTRQNADFERHVFPTDSLELAVDWIKANLSPEDVFDASQLAEYARANLTIDDVYPEADTISYVSGTFDPSEVFSAHELAAWAEDEGYVKE